MPGGTSSASGARPSRPLEGSAERGLWGGIQSTPDEEARGLEPGAQPGSVNRGRRPEDASGFLAGSGSSDKILLLINNDPFLRCFIIYEIILHKLSLGSQTVLLGGQLRFCHFTGEEAVV